MFRDEDDVTDDVDMTSRVTLRRQKHTGPPAERPTSIAERLSQLYESRESWKSKVEEKDVDQFTVEGKMNRLGQSGARALGLPDYLHNDLHDCQPTVEWSIFETS